MLCSLHLTATAGQSLFACETLGRLLLLCVTVRERQLEDPTGSCGVQCGDWTAHDKGHQGCAATYACEHNIL